MINKIGTDSFIFYSYLSYYTKQYFRFIKLLCDYLQSQMHLNTYTSTDSLHLYLNIW